MLSGDLAASGGPQSYWSRRVSEKFLDWRFCCAFNGSAQTRHAMSYLLATQLAGALLIADQLHGKSARRAESPNISHWWLTEEAAVFPIELAGAFIANLEGRTGCVEAVDEHASPSCLQAKQLLILKRAHGRQRPEMMVQRGQAHTRNLCEIFYTQRFRVVCLDPGDCFCRSVALISQRGNRSKTRPLRSAKNPINYFALNQTAQKRNIQRSIQQIYEPAASAEEFRCRFPDRHGRTVSRHFRHSNLFTAE